MKEDPWDYVHITTYNFLPFLLARTGKSAAWTVKLLTVIWFATLGATLALLNYIRRGANRDIFEQSNDPT